MNTQTHPLGALVDSMLRYDAWRQADADARDLLNAKSDIGDALAAKAGLSGEAAAQFRHGFAGLSIKWANPRKYGFEAEFRAGAEAAKVAANRIAVTQAAAAMHSIVSPLCLGNPS